MPTYTIETSQRQEEALRWMLAALNSTRARPYASVSEMVAGEFSRQANEAMAKLQQSEGPVVADAFGLAESTIRQQVRDLLGVKRP